MVDAPAPVEEVTPAAGKAQGQSQGQSAKGKKKGGKGKR